MSTAPATLTDLSAYWRARGGVMLGIVGNKAHTQGYHLGKDRIFDGSGPGVGWNDYSVKLTRDKNGLTNYVSAIDLGKLNGSLGELRKFSKWLVSQCQKNATGTNDIREIIYTPDGKTVQRYSGVDGKIHTGPGNGDLSHITHTHISYYRDSRTRDKTVAFKPYFVPAIPDTSTSGETVNSYPVPPAPSVGHVAKGATLYTSSDCNASDPQRIIIDPGRDVPWLGTPFPGVHVVEYVNASGVHTGKSYFVKDAELTNRRALPATVVDDGYTKATQDAAVKVQYTADKQVIDQQAALIAETNALKAALKKFLG